MGMPLKLSVLEEGLAICQLPASDFIPNTKEPGTFYSITKTGEEVSIVCEESVIPPNAKFDKGWKAIKVEGPLDFSLTGILSSIANPLAKNAISIFAISTFNTDYILVKEENLDKAAQTLSNEGFKIILTKGSHGKRL